MSTPRREMGSLALEFLLYLPIACALLFVAGDTGLGYLQRAAMSDAIRSGLNSESICKKQFGSTATPRSIVSCIGDEILQTAISKNILGRGFQVKEYRLTVRLVNLEIDSDTGRLLNYSITPAYPNSISAGEFDAQKDTVENFLKDQFSSEWDRTVSSFAVPAGVSFNSNEIPSSARFRYCPVTHGIYVKLDFEPRRLSVTTIGTSDAMRHPGVIEQFSLLRLQGER